MCSAANLEQVAKLRAGIVKRNVNAHPLEQHLLGNFNHLRASVD